ncbi:MAG: NAD(P)/FAD-dependent oxidoreductase, partial [Anaerolineales bacterium]|nr:NAD(P)/FAD-dependent oxidoreductase [Anaerolineales bacterium]
PKYWPRSRRRMKIEDVIVIGGGPAGMAVAIQLKRYGITPLLFEKGHLGGLLKNANLVENYPGFPGGIKGTKLIGLFVEQFTSLALSLIQEQVINVHFEQELFRVYTPQADYRARVLVIASGTRPRSFRELTIPPELVHRVHYEVYPLQDERGRTIAIIGAGDAAFDYGLNLARHNTVFILNRGRVIKCLPLLWQRAQANAQIQYFDNLKVLQILPGTEKACRLVCERPTEQLDFHVDYLIGAIGREAHTDFLSDPIRQAQDTLQARGLLYFIGDVTNDIYRQTAIAVGDGIKAAMQIYQKLSEAEP